MLLTAVVFFIILSILVLVHELGHYAVARFVGVHVEEFGFGLPPTVWGKKIGKTIYSINWLPIGGFVRLAGEDEEEGKKLKLPRKEYFWARSKKERTAILLAGVFMNFLLAWGITTYLFTQGVYHTSGRVHVEQVVAGGPAATAGIEKNDIVELVSDAAGEKHSIGIPNDLTSFTYAHRGELLTLTILRGNTTMLVHIVPRTVVPAGQGPMGVAISDLEMKQYSLTTAPWAALKETGSRTKDMLVGIWVLLVNLVRLKPIGGDVAGPIGIAAVTGQAVKFGFKAVLEFMSILSLNLAVLNALPIPALDGGRVLFVFVEKILGRKVKPAFERQTHQIGMIILLFLVLLVSIHDILRFAHGQM